MFPPAPGGGIRLDGLACFIAAKSAGYATKNWYKIFSDPDTTDKKKNSLLKEEL